MYEYIPSTGKCFTPKQPPCKDHHNMQCLCRVSIESSRPRARLQSEALNTILLALGTTLNTPDAAGKKAMWLPSQKARFLGMHVDAAHQRFILPEEKKQDLKKTADSVPQSSVVFNRQLAQLACKMVAAAPAVHLPPYGPEPYTRPW